MKKIFNRLYNYYFKDGHNERMSELRLQLAEIDRQRARVNEALALYKEVANSYGAGYVYYLTPLEDIVRDNKPITLINYFNV